MAYRSAVRNTTASVGSRGRTSFTNPVDKKTKSVKYSETDNTLLLDVTETDSETASTSSQIQAVKVRNDGYVPANALFAFTKYTSESDTSEAVEYLQFLLNPKEEITLPATRAIISTLNRAYDGTAKDSQAPDSNMYIAVDTVPASDAQLLAEALDGTDPQLKEGYSFLTKPQLRKFKKFHEDIIESIEKYADGKSKRKP